MRVSLSAHVSRGGVDPTEGPAVRLRVLDVEGSAASPPSGMAPAGAWR